MRLFTVSSALLLILAACAPAAPTAAPTKSEPNPSLSEVSEAASKRGLPVQYETSLLAGLWDGKTRGYQVLPVEPSSGQPVPGYAPIPVGVNYFYAFSADKKTLAILGYKSDSPHNPILHHIDLPSWQDTPTEFDLTGWASGLAFSPDGRFVAVAANYRESIRRDSTLLIFNLEQNQTVAHITPDFDVTRLKFTTDGSALMAYGTPLILNRPAKAALFDAANLSMIWAEDLKGVRDGVYPLDPDAGKETDLHEDPGSALFLYPGLVFAPGRDSLYAVHADEDKLTTVDFEARSVSTVSIQPKLSWFERFLMLTADVAYAKIANGTSRNAVISPDGSTIYTAGIRHAATQSSTGDWEFTQIPLGLQAIDAGDGSELFKLDTSATELRIVPDGSSLLLQSWKNEVPSIDVLDVKTGYITGHFKDAFIVPAMRMDGTPLLVSSIMYKNNMTRMSAYSMDGELLGEWQVPIYGDWLIAP